MVEVHSHERVSNLSNHTIHPVTMGIHHRYRVAFEAYCGVKNSIVFKDSAWQAYNHLLPALTVSIGCGETEAKRRPLFQTFQVGFKCR